MRCASPLSNSVHALRGLQQQRRLMLFLGPRFLACSLTICISLRQSGVSTTGAPVTKEGVLMQDGERLYISYGKKVCALAILHPCASGVVHTRVLFCASSCIRAVVSRI